MFCLVWSKAIPVALKRRAACWRMCNAERTKLPAAQKHVWLVVNKTICMLRLCNTRGRKHKPAVSLWPGTGPQRIGVEGRTSPLAPHCSQMITVFLEDSWYPVLVLTCFLVLPQQVFAAPVTALKINLNQSIWTLSPHVCPKAYEVVTRGQTWNVIWCF